MHRFDISYHNDHRIETLYVIEPYIPIAICYCNIHDNIATVDVIRTNKEYREQGLAFSLLKEIEKLGYDVRFPSEEYISNSGCFIRDKWEKYKLHQLYERKENTNER